MAKRKDRIQVTPEEEAWLASLLDNGDTSSAWGETLDRQRFSEKNWRPDGKCDPGGQIDSPQNRNGGWPPGNPRA